MAMGSMSSSPRWCAPIEEALYRARVRHPGIAVADGRGKEFDKAAAGAFALSADNRRYAFEPRTSAGGGMI
jgi:hypothetical protein